MPSLTSLDHLVLTVLDIAATCRFYETVLGMETETFTPEDGTKRWAVKFGSQKINLHKAGQEFEPKAAHPKPGSGDLCFLTDAPLADWIAHLKVHGVPLEDGPVARTGALGPMTSLYLRDPDQNLIEIAKYA